MAWVRCLWVANRPESAFFKARKNGWVSFCCCSTRTAAPFFFFFFFFIHRLCKEEEAAAVKVLRSMNCVLSSQSAGGETDYKHVPLPYTLGQWSPFVRRSLAVDSSRGSLGLTSAVNRVELWPSEPRVAAISSASP